MAEKTHKQLERYFKGSANHCRIAILLLLSKTPKLTLEGITSILKGNNKTISEHTKKLFIAGLISKKYKGQNVEHTLSPYGEKFCVFIKSF